MLGTVFSSTPRCRDRSPNVGNRREDGTGECPHEGSARRPDMGILWILGRSALLIQEHARNSSLARHLQSWCTRATTGFAQVQNAVRPQLNSGRRMMKSNHLALLLRILVF